MNTCIEEKRSAIPSVDIYAEPCRRILVSTNTSWNIINFRSSLVRALVADGYDVVAVAPSDAYSTQLSDIGCRHVPINMDRKGKSPFRDMLLLLGYLKTMRSEKPDIFLGWTIKPNIYGTLAARVVGVQAINNVSGLGNAFMANGWLARIAKFLYRIALNRSSCVFFQNSTDAELFINSRIVKTEQVRLLPGSGVNIDRFSPTVFEARDVNDPPVFILIARILWDKGIGEYVEAARIVKSRFPDARFQLLGFLDDDNSSAVPREAVDGWVQEGIIDYLGQTDDVRPHMAAASCVVLPSYYPEGTPRSLLEAAAMGKPIITTDTPGCRNVVSDGENGWICRPRDALDLADRMLRFIEASGEHRLSMSQKSRLKAEQEFDERLVIGAYVDAINAALKRVD